MKNWIASIVVALAGLGSGQAAGEPNIVLIMADDMGYECVTANGGESYSTPNLDRLARGDAVRALLLAADLHAVAGAVDDRHLQPAKLHPLRPA